MKHPVGAWASRSSCFIFVSGNKSFAAARAAGADIIEADNKCPGDTVYIYIYYDSKLLAKVFSIPIGIQIIFLLAFVTCFAKTQTQNVYFFKKEIP